MKKIKPLYIVLPLLFFLIVHALFAYAIWDFNPANWTEGTRVFSTFVQASAIVLSVIVASQIYGD